MEQTQLYKSHRIKIKGTFSKILLVCTIFFGIQLMNQFLIITGSALERSLSVSDPFFFVGVYQQGIQALAGILLYFWIFKRGIKELGIQTKTIKADLKYFWIFAGIWVTVIIIYVGVVYFWFPETWESMKAIPVPPDKFILSTLAFQSFFPGFGEEILFRGLIVSLLSNLVFTGYQNNIWQKTGIILFSSMYFALAHIYFSLSPLEIMHFDPTQIAMALGCGGFYTVVYLKTKSLLAPFLSHNFSNITSTVVGYLISGL